MWVAGGWVNERMERSLGSGANHRRMVHAVGHAARSSVGALHANRHASCSFGAFGARCTQFCNTVHAVEAWCTQLFAGPERRAASSTCAFDASRSFRGLRNCVYRTPLACSMVRNCVHRAPVACSVGGNCVHRAPVACSVGGNCVHHTSNCVNRASKARARAQTPPTSDSLPFPPASHAAAPRQPNPNRVTRATDTRARNQRQPPSPSSHLPPATHIAASRQPNSNPHRRLA